MLFFRELQAYVWALTNAAFGTCGQLSSFWPSVTWNQERIWNSMHSISLAQNFGVMFNKMQGRQSVNKQEWSQLTWYQSSGPWEGNWLGMRDVTGSASVDWGRMRTESDIRQLQRLCLFQKWRRHQKGWAYENRIVYPSVCICFISKEPWELSVVAHKRNGDQDLIHLQGQGDIGNPHSCDKRIGEPDWNCFKDRETWGLIIVATRDLKSRTGSNPKVKEAPKSW